MDDLRQLLRYEIPGLTTIIYFLMLSRPVLMEYGRLSGVNFEQFSKILPGIVIMVPVMALPIGFVVYQLYTTVEHENYLKMRRGRDVVTEVLRVYPSLERESRWWEENKEDTIKGNEILDAVFYMNNREWTKILERFESFYHSRRVVGIYSPVTASLAVMSTTILMNFTFWKFILLISVLVLFAFFIAILNRECIWRKIDELDFVQYCLVYSLIIGIYMLIGIYTYSANCKTFSPESPLIAMIILILPISLIMITPTREQGLLRRGMSNLEENIILSEISSIMEVIDKQIFVFEQNKT